MGNLNRRQLLKWGVLSGAAGIASLSIPPSVRAKSSAQVIVIGGGFGGATCANYLRKYDSSISVTLIEPRRTFVTCPFSNRVIAGLDGIDSITHDYQKLREKRGVNIIHDTVIGLDAVAKKVILQNGHILSYDSVVVSPGIDFDWDQLDGIDSSSSPIMPHAWQSGKQTILLRDQLMAMDSAGVVVLAVPRKPFRAPQQAYERASLIGYYLKTHKPKAKILILDANPSSTELDHFRQGWSQLYDGMIEWVGGNEGAQIKRVDTKDKALFTQSGEMVKGNVINLIPPQKAGAIAQSSGLTGQDGWCPVDAITFESTRYKDVYVIGDSSNAGELHKTAHCANLQAKICAATIVSKFLGTTVPKMKYMDAMYSFLGPKYCITTVNNYRVEGGGIRLASTELSPLGASKRTRLKEARFARGWYKAITSEMFGG